MGLGHARAEPAAKRARWPRVRRRDRRMTVRDFYVLGGRDAPRTARAAIADLVDKRLDQGSRDAVGLMLSEMVTNSVIHGDGGSSAIIAISVTLLPSALRVEVADPRGGFEVRPKPGPLANHGRGLEILAELASRWGVRNRPNGHVWFELDSPA